MKGLLKKLAICVFALFCLVGFTACGESNKGPTAEEVAAERQSALNSLEEVYSALDLDSYLADDIEAKVNELKAAAKKAIEEAKYESEDGKEDLAKDIEAIKAALSQAKSDLQEYLLTLVELANGTYSYVAASYEKRTEILGILEKYATEAGLTGITLYEDSGFIMYNPLVQKGSDNYIPNYGFGILSEGRANGDLEGESNAAWKRYYHTYLSEDPKTINYGNDQGSTVGSIVGYIADSYWGTRMNETKDGYEWYSSLANEKPQALNASSVTGLATKYKFEVKIGSELKYNTLTTNSTLAKYAGQEVKIEDYLTIWKVLHTQSNGWYRATDDLEGANALKGMAAYYNASSEGADSEQAIEAWKKVGLKAYEVDGKGYIEVEFLQPCSSFYAMYYLNSSIWTPVPESFIDEIGGAKNYGAFDLDNGLTPVDTTLATGPYVLEKWDVDQQIVFKKNEYYFDKTLYQGWEGVHVAVLSSIKLDREAALKEFNANRLTSCSIPSTKLKELKNDPRTCQTVGSTTTKLNLNVCDQEMWIKLFGEEGTITQTAKEDYWECEPALANHNFILGISYAINRKELADSLGASPSVNYFGSSYMADPENGVIYNNTETHKNAIADLIDGTDGYGYSLEKARAYFKKACEELLASGVYKEGDVITLEIAWMAQSQNETYHKPIEKYLKEAFNHESVCDGKLTLEIEFWVGAKSTDVYYSKMMIGQFDIAYGGIEGNSLNPLNFMEVLKSDNSSTFTLNWGIDTNQVTEEIMYDGVAWSFDALWQAAETGGYFENGKFVPTYSPELLSSKKNDDGTATIEIKANFVKAEGVSIEIEDVLVFGYLNVDDKAKYSEDKVEFEYDSENDIVKVTVNAELYEKYAAALKEKAFGIDLYMTQVVLEIESSPATTVYLEGLPE